MLFNQQHKNIFSVQFFLLAQRQANKLKVPLSNFYTAHVDVGPTLTLRFAPIAKYKRYNVLPKFVNRSHAIFTDLMKLDNTTEWSCTALYTIAQ